MTSITFVCKEKDFTKECAENWSEYVLDETGIKGFCDRILVNNQEVWKLEEENQELKQKLKRSKDD